MAQITPEEFNELMTAYLAEHGSEIAGVIPDEEFRQKFMAMLEETGFSEANVDDVMTEIDDSVFMTGVEYSTDEQGNPVTPLHYIRAKMSLWQGPKGDTGSQGPKGDKGDTGEQGPQGIQGE